VLGTDDLYREAGYVALSRGPWGIGATERRRLIADIEALDGRPTPEPLDDLDLGLERDL